MTVVFRARPFDAAESGDLIEQVQQEYVMRYGSPDRTKLEVAEFAPPAGVFVIGWDGDRAVACGGVRMVVPGLGELKRMYVVPDARRRGIARLLLAHLEEEARRLGATRLRLETGMNQPEALALYQSAGYVATEPFGYYAGAPLARHLAKELEPPRSTG
jgi:GNAT superfamily N-acetyltransferase